MFKTPLILDYTASKKASLKNTYMFRPESDDIKKLCEKAKVHFIRRPKNLCSDTSSSESAILHSLKAIGNKIDNIIFSPSYESFKKTKRYRYGF